MGHSDGGTLSGSGSGSIEAPTDAAFVRRLFNQTAPHYDLINQIFSLGSGGWYRRRCLRRAGLKPGHTVLDVAIGTGLIAEVAQRIVGPKGSVYGLDLSEAMLQEARRKLDLPLIQGTADMLPIQDGSIDFLVMGYALRHIRDLESCFREFFRVLRPGGVFLLLEVSSPTRAIYRSTLARYLGRAVPAISRMVTRRAEVQALMAYHWETMETCVAPPEINQTIVKSGFTNIVCEGWFDLFRSYSASRP